VNSADLTRYTCTLSAGENRNH